MSINNAYILHYDNIVIILYSYYSTRNLSQADVHVSVHENLLSILPKINTLWRIIHLYVISKREKFVYHIWAHRKGDGKGLDIFKVLTFSMEKTLCIAMRRYRWGIYNIRRSWFNSNIIQINLIIPQIPFLSPHLN